MCRAFAGRLMTDRHGVSDAPMHPDISISAPRDEQIMAAGLPAVTPWMQHSRPPKPAPPRRRHAWRDAQGHRPPHGGGGCFAAPGEGGWWGRRAREPLISSLFLTSIPAGRAPDENGTWSRRDAATNDVDGSSSGRDGPRFHRLAHVDRPALETPYLGHGWIVGERMEPRRMGEAQDAAPPTDIPMVDLWSPRRRQRQQHHSDATLWCF